MVEGEMHLGPQAIGEKTFWVLKFAFALSLIPSFYPLHAQPSKDERQTLLAGPKLTLRVYNYAGIDAASLSRSEKVADVIFRNVAIEPVWVDCPTSKRNVALYQACDTPMGPADFVLRILPRGMAAKLHRSEDSLGSAQICSVSEPACELNVFYHRVDELAAKGYRGDRILGYAIAHEVAHILLGPKHSDDGILRAFWSPSDLDRISLGLQLDFTGDQSKQLRLALLRRTTPTQGTTIQANLVGR